MTNRPPVQNSVNLDRNVAQRGKASKRSAFDVAFDAAVEKTQREKVAAVKLLRAVKVDGNVSVAVNRETLLAMVEELEEKVAAARAALEAL